MNKFAVAALFSILYCFLLGFNLSILQAQKDTLVTERDAPSLFETMVREDLLNITLKTDQKKLIGQKKKEVYQPAIISYEDLDGHLIEREIDVKSRGNMRLKTCFYPPLRIKISKKDIGNEGLKPHRKLKLVVGCNYGDDYEQLVLREYLVYKLYNIITDNSFRVLLISLRMEDSEEKKKPRDGFAFIISAEDELAERLGGIIFEPKSVARRSLNQDPSDLLSIFQFMIGNTDWFAINRHNLKYVRIEVPMGLIPVAFDFDFAGIVNAPYAEPNQEMPIRSVRERFFIGDCREEGHYEKVIQHFVAKKPQLLNLVRNFSYLTDRSRDYMLKYLTESFAILENPKSVKKEIMRGCDWMPMALR